VHVSGPFDENGQRFVVETEVRELRIILSNAVPVVDEEDEGLRMLGQITARDALAVAREIGKTERLVVQHLEEAVRSAAMLDVGLALGVGRSEEDARLASDELGQIGCDARLPRFALFHARIAMPRTLTGLDSLDGWREGDIAEIRSRRWPLHCGATFSIEEIADQRDHFIGLVFESEMPGIDEMKLHVGQVMLVRMRPVGREDLVVPCPRQLASPAGDRGSRPGWLGRAADWFGSRRRGRPEPKPPIMRPRVGYRGADGIGDALGPFGGLEVDCHLCRISEWRYGFFEPASMIA
jgi:hypothetical protein